MRIFCPECQNIFPVEPDKDKSFCLCPKCQNRIKLENGKVFPGVVLGDFLVENLISSGGMGAVYVARQLSLDREVALKVLLDKFGGSPEYIETLLHEARAAAKLNHPNIVQAYAVGEEDGVFYFAMEYIRGETYKKILAREKKLSPLDAAQVIRDVAGALDAAYREQKIVHRDIKPENIMRDVNGFTKLADLGLAQKSGSGSVTDSDEVTGTPQYISPEQLSGLPADPRSDIYSLGATFYHFVTGRFPYLGKSTDEITEQHIKGNLTPPREIVPDLPEAINDIIVKMMARDIEKRYQSPADVVKDLDEYIQLEISHSTLKMKMLKDAAKAPKRKKISVPLVLWSLGILILLIAALCTTAVILENFDKMPSSIAPAAQKVTAPLRKSYHYSAQKCAILWDKCKNIFASKEKDIAPAKPVPAQPEKQARADFIKRSTEIMNLSSGKKFNPDIFAEYCDFLSDYSIPSTAEERKILSKLLDRFAAVEESRIFAAHRADARAALEKNAADAKARRLAEEKAKAEEAERLRREAEAKAAEEKLRKENSDRQAREYRENLISEGKKLLSAFSKSILENDEKIFISATQHAVPALPDNNPVALKAAEKYQTLLIKLKEIRPEVVSFASSLDKVGKLNISISVPGHGMAKVQSISPDGKITLTDLSEKRFTVDCNGDSKILARALNSLGKRLNIASKDRNQAILFFALYLDKLDQTSAAAAKDDFWKNYLNYTLGKE